METNVRANKAPQWLRFSLGTLDRVAPRWAARVAEELFLTPPPTRLSRPARRVLRSGRPFTVRLGKERIKAWSWGQGPVVLLVHGWGGRASQMRPFIQPLVEAGYRAVALDAPGHGETSRGHSSLLHFKSALLAVEAEVNGLFGVVAHSMGGGAAVLALREGLRPARMALLAAPAYPAAFASRFGQAVGIQSHTIRRMQERIESRFGMRWANLDLPQILKERPLPLLVVHDTEDTDVPVAEARLLASATPAGELHVTQGLGHRAVLRSPEVVHKVVDFVTDGGWRSLCLHGRRAESCPACTLEAELFAPERRW